MDISSPTAHGVVVEPGTCVVMTTADFYCCPAGAKVNGHQVIAHLPAGVPYMVRAPNSQLAIAVVSPAREGVVVEPSTRVFRATTDLCRCPAGAQVNGH